ncbi:MAG: type IV conjugative transfer system coupling protein TraD [Parachlamydia sp.]|jgi:type IV conjugative transfer system coupling protein TraD|nr:type IV conjugative transfer system coupling protein TraD [Parachlamydia sp.]
MRMFKQVIKIALLLSIIIWIAGFCYSMSQNEMILYRGTLYHLQAKYFQSASVETMEVDPIIWQKLTGENRVHPRILTKRVLIGTQRAYNQFKVLTYQNIVQTSKQTLVSFVFVIFFFFLRGKRSKNKKHISGKKVVSAWKINLLVKWKYGSSIKIGNVLLPKNSETQHILVSGGTGSGKTNCFNHILPQIRDRHQKAIIIDTTGGFVERYYRPGKDILLNPCDPRGLPWHPWAECQEALDFESLAEGFIPQSYAENDNYWRSAARCLFSSTLQKLQFIQKNSVLTNQLLFESLANLATFLTGTKAASHIDLNSEKTAGTIRSVATTFLGSLEYLKDTENPFSIKNWVEETNNDSWLFLACTPIQRSVMNPLIASWFSIAIRSLMQMAPCRERRLWFILDELPSLHKLKDLETLLSEGRKYGACALLALQSPAQLNAIYGSNGAKTIIGNCATKVVFSEQNPEMAEQISKMFGGREIKEYQEGLSYGANDVRDGVNLSLQTRQMPLVSSTDIQFLEKNKAYIKLAGNLPITKNKFKIQ